MTLNSHTFGGRNYKQKTSLAFFIGVWCQFREHSVTARERRRSMCKHLLFCLEYCQHQANQNSDLLLNCLKCQFWLHFQTHTKPTHGTKSHSLPARWRCSSLMRRQHREAVGARSQACPASGNPCPSRGSRPHSWKSSDGLQARTAHEFTVLLTLQLQGPISHPS